MLTPTTITAHLSRSITLLGTGYRLLSHQTICARYFITSTRINLTRTRNTSPMSTTAHNQDSPPQIELLTSLEALRAWRAKAREQDLSVGFVPTMGALHDGHLSLVRHSMQQNPLTVVSIFVNPAQFAPHEDLATYPRTLDKDLELLKKEVVELPQGQQDNEGTTMKTIRRYPSAVFIPSVKDMYPAGITQDVSQQRGTFVQVKGLEEQMEGKSRPGFFRGVATIVLKLFNAVEPTHAYFGQKDIQQALLLRQLTKDLLLSHPLPENLHIVPTTRDPVSGLALSSRNAYLTDKEREYAPTLWRALGVGRNILLQKEEETGEVSESSNNKGVRERVKEAAERIVKEAQEEAAAQKNGVLMRLDYVELNWADTLEPVVEDEWSSDQHRPVILSGALWVGRTRLIDNMIIGDAQDGLLR